MSSKIATFTDQNWQSEVLGSPHPVLVDFWAEWCVPCRTLVPAIEAVAAHYDGKLRVGKLNVEENIEVASRYGITGLPTLMIFKGGQVSEQRVGLISKDGLVKLIDAQVS